MSAVGPYAQDGYALVNARIGLAFDNGLELTAFIDNLTNSRSLQNRASDTFGLGLVVDTFTPPRQFGGRLSFRF